MKIEILNDRQFEESVPAEAGPFRKWLKLQHPEIDVTYPNDSTIYDLHDYSIIMPWVNLASDMSLQSYLALVLEYIKTYKDGMLEGERDEVQINAYYQDTNKNITKEFNFKGSSAALQANMEKFNLNKFME